VDPYRLPRGVVPSLYELCLIPDLESATFTGTETVHIRVVEPLDTITLNAIELRIDSATFEAGDIHISAHATLDETTERCHLAFSQTLPIGPAQLRIEFAGVLNDQLRGFYRSRYRATDGSWRLLAATQFEATDARRAFPCWDEPSFKAVFRTTLIVPAELQAISNTAMLEQSPDEIGRKVVRFADTIPMSTYLVAFIVGELELSAATVVGTTPLKVWAVPGKETLAGFGAEIAACSLRYFEEYYDRPYPGDKLDLIAIPDFAAGAMENLGAITFRETALLINADSATHAEKERVADVVAHENAHMWFGDLVTMEWWNGLWLNEAFATFMGMAAVDAWKPAWSRWVSFGVSRSAALTIDGLRSTRPIEFPVHAPADAEAMFDVLTYEKGASVLRMLEQYIGPDVFRAGVRLYLERHEYHNTETTDLWNALKEASNLDIPALMDGWVFRPGYPIVKATRAGEELILTQQRFGYLPLESESDQEWHIPIQLRAETPAGPETRRVLLTGPEVRIALSRGTTTVLVNEGGHGFYRVRYTPELLSSLLGRLDRLEAIERFGLVNDAWAAVLAGLAPLTEFLDLTLRFRDERDRNVWSVLLGAFQTLNRMVDDEDRSRLAALVRDRLGPSVEELGWSPKPGEDELTGQLRADLLRAQATLGDDAGVQQRAKQVYAEGTADTGVLSAAIAILAHVGDAARYEAFLASYRSASSPQEEQRYLQALAAFRPPELVARTLELTLSKEVRTQDAPLLLRSLLMGVHSRAAAWEFVRSRCEEMRQAFPPVGFRRLWEGLIALARPEWEAEVAAFLKEHPLALGGKTLEQYREQQHIAVQLRERERENLRRYMG
jgi:puromycin-sensitive aminopeptidase